MSNITSNLYSLLFTMCKTFITKSFNREVQDHLVHKVKMENQEPLYVSSIIEKLVCMYFLNREMKVPLELPVCLARKEPRDPLDLQEHQEPLDLLVKQEMMVMMAQMETKENQYVYGP